MRGGRLVVLASVVVAVAGCLPAGSTQEARSTTDLYRVFVGAAVVVAAIVWGLLTTALVRFRRARMATGEPALPDQVRGDIRLEALWTAVPALTVAALFALTLVTLNGIEAISGSPGVRLEVTAFRWGWTIRYPDDGVVVTSTAPGQAAEFAVPVGQPVHVSLTAADVAHAFYVPAFLYKRDAYPGRVQQFDFTVEQAGTYGGQCAEFCGTFHARMPITVQALDEGAFEAWLAQRRSASAP